MNRVQTVALAVIILLLVPVGAVVDADSATQEQQVTSIINQYFIRQYDSMTDGQFRNFRDLFGNSTVALETYRYEAGSLRLHLAVRRYCDAWLSSYTYEPNYKTVQIANGEATVVIQPLATYWDDRVKNTQYLGYEEHELHLLLGHSGWKINSDEYEAIGKDIDDANADWEELIRSLPEQMQALNNISVDPQVRALHDGFAEGSFQTLATRSYSRSAAVSYALSWSENYPADPYRPDSYNDDFQELATDNTYSNGGGNDCANFVSQCIWKGFGGSVVDKTQLPMVYNVPGATNWYGVETGWAADAWVGATALRSYVQSNYDNGLVGVQGTAGPMEQTYAGDFVHIDGHVMFITTADDANHNGQTDWDEIHITAHTENKLDYSVLNFWKTKPSHWTFMWVIAFREP